MQAEIEATSITGSIVVYASPSEAIRRALDQIGSAPSSRIAIAALEAGEPERVQAKLRHMACEAPDGSIVVNLSAQELARPSLPAEFRFHLLGNAKSAEHGVERLFLLDHPQLGEAVPEPEPRAQFHDYFIGRRREFDDLRARLDHHRTVILYGPSGIGKSALARRFAGEYAISEDGFGEVIEVDLTGITRSQMVVPVLWRLIRPTRLPNETPLEALVGTLFDRRALVVFDHPEGVLSEVARVASALTMNTENVGVVIVSRRAPSLKGANRMKLAGLAWDADSQADPSHPEADAVRLFVDRAQLIEDTFVLTPRNRPAIESICRHLDGNPLAIEMAANWVNVLSAEDILKRLDVRFTLLRDQSEDRPERHRTLWAAIDSTYQGLSPAARILLRRLSVFSGTFSLDEASLLAQDDRLPSDDIAYAFSELADASLIVPSPASGSVRRFGLPESAAAYAKECLRKAGEDLMLERRHRNYCLNVIAEGGKGLAGERQIDWLERIDACYEDLRRVVEAISRNRGDLGLAMQCLIDLGPFFLHRTYHGEGLRLVERVLRHDGARHHGLYPRLLNFAAVLAIRLGEVAEGRHYAIESLRASRQAGNRFTEAASRSTLSIAADELGRKGRTRRHLEAALAIYRELGDERYIANALVNLLGYIDHLHPTRASSVIREAEALLEKSPVPVLSAVLDLNRAHLLLRDRAYTEAIGASMRAIEFFGTTGNIESITVGWRNIAYALEGLEQFSAAARLVGSMRNLARHPEYRMRPKYEDSWMALEMRLRQRLGIRYEEYVLAGQASGPPDSTDLR